MAIQYCSIKKINKIKLNNKIPVYDITVKDNHNFILSDSNAVVHNCNIFQDLQADGFKTEVVSVDRVQKDANGYPVCLPYHYFKTAIYERRLIMYEQCDQLTNEIIGLVRKSDGHVDHTKEDGGIDSKDQCDAVCGAVWLASKYAASGEYSYNYGDNLVASLDANGEVNDNYAKQQLMVDFEEELKKISLRNFQGDADENSEDYKKRKEEVDYLNDINDGIFYF